MILEDHSSILVNSCLPCRGFNFGNYLLTWKKINLHCSFSLRILIVQYQDHSDLIHLVSRGTLVDQFHLSLSSCSSSLPPDLCLWSPAVDQPSYAVSLPDLNKDIIIIKNINLMLKPGVNENLDIIRLRSMIALNTTGHKKIIVFLFV